MVPSIFSRFYGTHSGASRWEVTDDSTSWRPLLNPHCEIKFRSPNRFRRTAVCLLLRVN